MEFQAIYSRKIQGAVMLFTVFMFACQYGLTKGNSSRKFFENWYMLERICTKCSIQYPYDFFWFGMMIIFYQMRALHFEELFL